MSDIKNTIAGFNQGVAVDMGLTIEDLVLLRFFVDCTHITGRKTVVRENIVHYWVNYDSLLGYMPIFKKGKKALRQYNFMRLCNANILHLEMVHQVDGKKGNYSYYGFASDYQRLILCDPDSAKMLDPQKLPKEKAKKKSVTKTVDNSPFFGTLDPQKLPTLTHKSYPPLPTKVADKEYTHYNNIYNNIDSNISNKVIVRENNIIYNRQGGCNVVDQSPKGTSVITPLERSLLHSIANVINCDIIRDVPLGDWDLNALLNEIECSTFLIEAITTHRTVSYINNMAIKILMGKYRTLPFPKGAEVRGTRANNIHIARVAYFANDLDRCYQILINGGSSKTVAYKLAYESKGEW